MIMPEDQKYCNRPGCGKPIKWTKRGTRNIPLNMDGTDHHCSPSNAAKSDCIIGRMESYAGNSATFTVKGGAQKTYAITPGVLSAWKDAGFAKGTWLSFEKDAQGFIQQGKYKQVEVPEWAGELEAAQQPVTKPPAQEKPPETRTSPVVPPAAITHPPQSPEDCIRTAMSRIMPPERVGYRISLAGMVSSVIEMEKISTDAPKTYAELEADVKKKALELFLWCDRMTMQTIKDVQ